LAVVMVGAGVGAYLVLSHQDDKRQINIDVDLEVFGNADKNWKIDSNDAKLVSDYIAAVESGDTEKIDEIKSIMSMDFADANQDGSINQKDVDQINSLIDGSAKYVWLLEGVLPGKERTVRKIDREISRIGAEYFANTELCLILGLADKIAAVDYAPYKYKDFYFTEPQRENLSDMYNMSTPNYPNLNTLNLDILLVFYTSSYEEKIDKLIGCDVLYLGLYNPDLTNTRNSSFVQGVLKAGYIFGAVERAESYVDWLLGYRDQLLTLSNSIAEEDKKHVLMHTYGAKYFANGTDMTLTVYKPADPLGQAAILGGTYNVYNSIAAEDITSSNVYGATVSVDVILGDNTTVDYIFLHMVRYTYGASEVLSTPKHGYLINDTTEAQTGHAAVKNLEFVESTMSPYLVAGEFRNGCTGGVLLGAFIGSIVNPEVYKDVDPYKLMNEYVSWMGIEGYDSNTSGVFVYPGKA